MYMYTINTKTMDAYTGLLHLIEIQGFNFMRFSMSMMTNTHMLQTKISGNNWKRFLGRATGRTNNHTIMHFSLPYVFFTDKKAYA